MSLKNALNELNKKVQDLTSLHVQTFTGTVKSSVEGQSFDQIRQLVKNAETNAEIKLVAETLAQFDGDSYNFIKEDLTAVPPLALQVHKDAVQAGVETRLGLLNLFKDLLDG